jgi:hypothetical protein
VATSNANMVAQGKTIGIRTVGSSVNHDSPTARHRSRIATPTSRSRGNVIIILIDAQPPEHEVRRGARKNPHSTTQAELLGEPAEAVL